jgi:hypothetical protein
MAGTLQVLNLSDEICGQFPLSRLAGNHHWCTALRAFIGPEPGHKAFNPFAAENLALCSKPVRIRIPGFDLLTRSKVAFGGALKESLYEICSNFHIHQTTGRLSLVTSNAAPHEFLGDRFGRERQTLTRIVTTLDRQVR